MKHKPELEDIQELAKDLLEANKSDPKVCENIVDRLNDVAKPFDSLVNDTEDKQKKLDTVKKAIDNYNNEKNPLEEFIKATEEKVDHLEPFGLDPEEGDKQTEELEVRAFIYLYSYSRMGQVNFWNTPFKKIEVIWSVKTDYITSKILKVLFHKFYSCVSVLEYFVCFIFETQQQIVAL